MNTRPDPGSSRETGIMDFSRAQMDALRESIRDFLAEEPEREDRSLELYLVEVQSAIRMYLDPTAAEPSPRESRRDGERWARELDGVAKSARSLRATLEGLSGASRSRLVETTRLDGESLEELMRLARLAESEAHTARRQPSGWASSVGPTPKNPEIELVEKLSIVWARYTNERILRDREAESPWARFVEVACSIAGIDRGSAHQVRLGVYDFASLAESAELLATVPDP